MALRTNPNDDLEQLRYAAQLARRPFEKDWWLNIAFFLGEQYTEWSAESAALRALVQPQDTRRRRPRPVINKINHFALQQHAFALEARPTGDVLPADDGPQAISDSLVAKSLVDWVADPQVANFGAELSQATLWAVVCGPAFLHWPWNPDEKRPDIIGLSPFDLYPDPYVTRFRRARYAILSRFMDPEQVYNTYGVEVKTDAVERTDVMKTELLRQMGAAPVLKGVTVNELWQRPSRRYPDGRYIVWAGKQRLVDQTFPYEHKHLPFTLLGVIPRPGTLWYDSSVKYLRAPQMELNKYHAQRITVRENFANAKWWVPDECDLQELPDDSPWQVLRGSGTQGKPEIIQGAGMADNGEGEWIGQEMMNVVGLHEVSQAQVPGRVEAAKAIELLKEDDTSRLAELIDTTKDAIAEGFWQVLQLSKQYMPEDKILMTYGPEGLPEVRKFKKDSINPAQRILVTMGTGLGRSRAAREDRVFKMIEAGLLTDPMKIAQLLEVPLPHLVDTTIWDAKLARNENYAMANGDGPDGKPGVAIMPNSWDDHATHIREHNQYRKTIEFQMLDPNVKQKFEFHVQKHIELQQAQMQLQAQQVAAQQAQLAQYNQPALGGPGALARDAATAVNGGGG